MISLTAEETNTKMANYAPISEDTWITPLLQPDGLPAVLVISTDTTVGSVVTEGVMAIVLLVHFAYKSRLKHPQHQPRLASKNVWQNGQQQELRHVSKLHLAQQLVPPEHAPLNFYESKAPKQTNL